MIQLVSVIMMTVTSVLLDTAVFVVFPGPGGSVDYFEGRMNLQPAGGLWSEHRCGFPLCPHLQASCKNSEALRCMTAE